MGQSLPKCDHCGQTSIISITKRVRDDEYYRKYPFTEVLRIREIKVCHRKPCRQLFSFGSNDF